MRRLIWGFAGRTYHITGNLMSRLMYVVGTQKNSLVEHPKQMIKLMDMKIFTIYDHLWTDKNILKE